MAGYLAAVGTFGSIYALLALGLSLMWGMAGIGFAAIIVALAFFPRGILAVRAPG